MTAALEPSATLTFRIGALLVRGAGALVPLGKRSDWRREWEAELWHAVFACRRSGRPSMAQEGGLVLRCLGAYQHAAWLRARQLRRRRLRARITASAGALRADPRPAALALAAVTLTVGTAAVLFGVAGQSAGAYCPRPRASASSACSTARPRPSWIAPACRASSSPASPRAAGPSRASPPFACFPRRAGRPPRALPRNSSRCCR
jgi:hypothetical protein